MKVVGPSGSIVSGGLDWGCSHSGYERTIWDPRASKYVTICKNDALVDGLYGRGQGVADRAMYLQVRNSTTGAAVSQPISVAIKGNRYQEFRSFPDGSVAYAAPGSTTRKVKILRVMPCGS